jgi:hypothetical protein
MFAKYPLLFPSTSKHGYEGYIQILNEEFLIAIYSDDKDKLINPQLLLPGRLNNLLKGFENVIDHVFYIYLFYYYYRD